MTSRRPNLLFVMSDDHASHAISAYTRHGDRPAINHTPHLDRLADEGMRFDACFCTNSICTPSRAAVLTGTYNHVNGVTTLDTHMDNRLDTFPKRLQTAGYQTAMFGKWHLGHGATHDPTGFDQWRVLPGQGHYHDPVMLEPGPDGTPGSYNVVERGGYVTDLITDDCIDWLDRRDPDRPFALLCHHKAPHRRWESSPEHFTLYDNIDIAEPPTMWDDHEDKSEAIQAVRMRLLDLDPVKDLKSAVPPGLDLESEIRWRYQRYIKDYLRTIASIDDSMGRLLRWLDAEGVADHTMVVYTSDQGFFLGDHGWFDKRLMYEESLSMPLLVRYPAVVAPGGVCSDIALNVDFAPTFLELAGLDVPPDVQGTSVMPLLRGEAPEQWQTSAYYRYWMHRDGIHLAPAHYGVRTLTHKLICFYNDPLDQLGAHGPSDPVEWELYDLVADPFEVRNVIDHPAYADVRAELEIELARLQQQVGDTPYPT
ncbi:sulfatase [soil metagenome]